MKARRACRLGSYPPRAPDGRIPLFVSAGILPKFLQKEIQLPIFKVEELTQITEQIFKATGASKETAQIVSRVLVNSNLTGHDSHGVIRMPQYIQFIKEGKIIPQAETQIDTETPTTALLDGNWGFGHPTGIKAMEITVQKAKECSISAVGSFNSNHVGRLGEYTPIASKEGMVGVMMVNNHGGGQIMSPWGGRERRLSPNPISISVPTVDRGHITLDISCSVVAEGKVRIQRNRNERTPKGWIIDSEGNPTTDPADFYGSPQGSVLPLGDIAGHKGFGLAFMIDILSGALTGAGCSQANSPLKGANGIFAMAIDISSFKPLDYFTEQVQSLKDHVKSSRLAPGFDEILIPGEKEERERQKRQEKGIFVEDATWKQIREAAASLSLEV